MYFSKMFMCFVAVMMMAACGGAKSEAKGPDLRWHGEEVNESTVVATEGADDESTLYGQDVAPGPDTQRYRAQPADGMLPQECHGQVPAGIPQDAKTVICRCVAGDTEAMWARYTWDTGFPYCAPPRSVNSVFRRKVKPPPSLGVPAATKRADDNPYQAPAAKQTVAQSTTSSSRAYCTTRIDGQSRMIACTGADGATYNCVGGKDNVRGLTQAQMSSYSGGAPCTCADGSDPQKMGEPPNTWQCK